MRDGVLRSIYAVVLAAVSVLPFLTGVELAVWMVKMFRGIASFGALAALIQLA